MPRRFSQRFFTLKFRLQVLTTILLLLVVGGPLYFLLHHLDKNHHEFSVNLVETTTHTVYQSIFEDLLKNDTTAIQEKLEFIGSQPQIEHLRFYRPNGEILFSSRREEIRKPLQDLQVQDIFSSAVEGEAFIKSDEMIAHRHPIYIQQECLPCHTDVGSMAAMIDIQVELSESEQVYASIKQLTILSALLIVVVLWIVFNLLYENQIESRLKKIANGFEELAKGNFSHKINIPGRHELANLAQKFNQTVDELKSAKQKEKQLMQEKLERADRLVTLGEVAAEIAHEVNNPASIILTRAEFIRDELESQNGCAQYVEDLEMIVQQTERIAETTHSILHYARKRPKNFSMIDLNKVIQQSIKMLQPRFRKHGINICFESSQTPVMINGNFNQLEQVFCNLINNSLDALPKEGGRIDIEIQFCPLESNGSLKASTTNRIIYTDNGPGISETVCDDIFSPFFTTKQDGKGTGLGLFIARNIILHHGGDLYLVPQNSNGAKFIIELGAGNSNGKL